MPCEIVSAGHKKGKLEQTRCEGEKERLWQNHCLQFLAREEDFQILFAKAEYRGNTSSTALTTRMQTHGNCTGLSKTGMGLRGCREKTGTQLGFCPASGRYRLKCYIHSCAKDQGVAKIPIRITLLSICFITTELLEPSKEWTHVPAGETEN